ncbi:unnamed protein product [Rhizopus stolonifer]
MKHLMEAKSKTEFEETTVEVINPRARKMMGNKMDFLLKYNNDKLVVLRWERRRPRPMMTSTLMMEMIKLPKVLKDMLCLLIEKCPGKVNELITVSYIVMGVFFFFFFVWKIRSSKRKMTFVKTETSNAK